MTPPRYLVVDDSRTSRLLLGASLRAASPEPPEVAEVEGLDGLLEALVARRPDAVFLDLMLDLQRSGEPGGSSGLVALQLILDYRPTARVVLVTSLPPDHPDVASALGMGAAALLEKPVSIEAVRRVLVATGAARVGAPGGERSRAPP